MTARRHSDPVHQQAAHRPRPGVVIPLPANGQFDTRAPQHTTFRAFAALSLAWPNIRPHQNHLLCVHRPDSSPDAPPARVQRYAPPATSGSLGRRNTALQTATVAAALQAAVRLGLRPVVLVRRAQGTGRCGGPDILLGVRDERIDPSGPANPVPAAGTTPTVQQEPSPHRTGVPSTVNL